MKIKKFHHVAYRCIDAKQTVEWYAKYLNMDFILAIAEDEVPSTKEPDPYRAPLKTPVFSPSTVKTHSNFQICSFFEQIFSI